MYYRCHRSVVLWAIGLVVTVTVTSEASVIKVTKPFGTLMCERQCNRTIGCSMYMYIVTDLSCHLTDAKSIPKVRPKSISLYRLSENKVLTYGIRIRNCQKDANIFHSKSKDLKCTSTRCHSNRKEKLLRILFLSYSPRQHGHVFYTHNNSARVYSYFRGTYSAVAYIVRSGKLVIASHTPYGLYIVSLTGKNKTIVRRKRIVVRVMIVDETQALVFLACQMYKSGVYVMTTKGKDFKQIVTTTYVPYAIEADYKNSIIYVSLPKCIDIYDYDGTFQKQLSKGITVSAMVLDLEMNVLLYYVNGGDVHKMNLSDYSNTTVAVVKRKADSMLVIDGFIYIAEMPFKGSILRVTEGGSVKRITVGYKSYQVRMCTI